MSDVLLSSIAQQVLEKLPAELKAQQRNFAAVAARLKAHSATWMLNTDVQNLRQLTDTFLLHWCVLEQQVHCS